MAADKLTTTVSTKGQVVLPKAIREEHRWRAGTRLTIESTPGHGTIMRLTLPLTAISHQPSAVSPKLTADG